MGLWTIVILLISSITLFSVIQEGMAMSVPVIIYYEFLCISPWVALTPFIIWVARQYSFAEKITITTVAVHLAAMIFVFSLHTLAQSYVVSIEYDMALNWAYLQRDFLGFLDMRLMLYVGILLAVYGVDFHKKNREIKLREPRLRADLNRAKFQALINNIQPGFMLKTIDIIKEKLDGNVDEAEEILTDFSDLLRVMLNSVSKEDVPIYEDVRAYDLYINILQKRVGYTVEKKVSVDQECYDALVPSFLILIPILENIIQKVNDGEQSITAISYEAQRLGKQIYLRSILEGQQLGNYHITDIENGLEMNEILKRLKQKYGPNVKFKFENGEDQFSIKLMIPFQHADLQGRPAKMQKFIDQT